MLVKSHSPEQKGSLKGIQRTEKAQKRGGPCRGKTIVGAEGKMSQVRREEIRKVAAMVKRLKKNTEENTADPGQECTVVVG